MRLHPVEASWATQLDRQYQKNKKERKQERQKNRDHYKNVNGFILIISRMPMPKKEVIFISLEVLLQQNNAWK